MAVMKNITFLTGYYGSGKSEIAVNLAIQKQLDIVVDLDIINPYFRSREMEEELNKYHIRSISSDMKQKMNLDMPYISSKIFMPFHDKSLKAIYDLGGNDQGAKLLRQFDDYRDRDVDLFLVVNIYRYETSSADLIMKLINKIEGMGGFKVTGLINNSNLLRETTIEEIQNGEGILKEVSKRTKLPIVYTTYWEDVKVKENLMFLGETLKLKLYFRKKWL
ncbi:ATP-binding protein [Candidatus Izemoplasma sp. B36]|uniref:ATP-binding protein n=1 Tax=Candidatus Izemoplasma sp. B36 TaxID=3242468 RepID=UPI0035588829